MKKGLVIGLFAGAALTLVICRIVDARRRESLPATAPAANAA